jgi:hypothetical protein
MITERRASIFFSAQSQPHSCNIGLEMRRGLSILLVLFFSLGPLTAWSGADDDSRLPACCRRHGVHHCAMDAGMAAAVAQAASNSEPGFTAPAHCPYFPDYLAKSAASIAGLAADRVSLPAAVVQPHSPTALRFSIPLHPIRAHLSRGPPIAS